MQYIPVKILLMFLSFLMPLKPLTAQEKLPIALELVLAIDSSTSVDMDEFELQRRGLYEAFLHPEVIGSIEALGELGIAISVVQWAGTGAQETVVDWALLRNQLDAISFANTIYAAERKIHGMTDIGSVIRYSVRSMDTNEYQGYRRVIDISGDGLSDASTSRSERDRAIAQSVTINGLVIYNEDYDLGELAKEGVRRHYQDNVIGGDGAFLMTAASFEHFTTAIRNKLVREITGPATAKIDKIIE